MAAISNFTQAMKELTGFDDSPEGNNNQGNFEAENLDFQQREPLSRSERPRNEINIPSFENQGSSIITSTMIVRGNVESNDNLKVDGKISGNLKINSSVISNGTVIGDVNTDNISINGPLKGNISAKGNVMIGQQSVVAGDVSSQNVVIEGKVKGNLSVKDNTSVTEEGWISGDINTGSIVTDVGCVINGNITTKAAKTFEIDEKKIFEIGEI